MELTGGRLLARNAALSVAAELVPMAAAVLAIPILVRRLGTERFGLLSLAWVVVGYFSVLDLGLGKALTRAVASRLGEQRPTEIPGLVSSAMRLMGLLGVAAGMVLAALSNALAERWIHIPPGLRGEALTSFRLLAVAVPVVVATSGVRGVLEAQQRMPVLLAIRVPLGTLSYVAPLAVLPFSDSLIPVVAILVGVRCLSLGLMIGACRAVMGGFRRAPRPAWIDVTGLLRFGGWMTVSNVLAPVLTTLDRFVIGSVLSVAAVAYYAVPLDVVQYAGVLPGAIAMVLFPAFATSFVADRGRTSGLFAAGMKAHLALMFPCSLAIMAFGRDGLRLWLGAEFARQGAPVLRWVAFGLLVSALARVAFWLVQGVGRPDLPALFHAAELVVYVPLLWWATRSFGIVGAAAAWTARVVLDAVLLFGASQKFVPLSRSDRASLAVASATAFALLGLVPREGSVALRLAFVGSAAVGFAAVAWQLLLSPDERRRARRTLRPYRRTERVTS